MIISPYDHQAQRIPSSAWRMPFSVPNVEGTKITVKLMNGTIVNTRVLKGEDGCHYLEDLQDRFHLVSHWKHTL